jgi:hypothetical protein
MAGSKPGKTHHIYILGLPRKALFDLFNLVDPEIASNEERMWSIFGLPPHSFTNPDTLREAAPLREFGILNVSFKVRAKMFNSLPENMRAYIISKYPDHLLGYYIDKEGRCYKREDKERWTVLCPLKIRKQVDDKFPQVDDALELTHVHDKDQTLYVFVDDVGRFKKASAIVYLRS